MESFFIALASTSLFVTWVSTADLARHAGCAGRDDYVASATHNAATLRTVSLAPFGRPEQGWQIYEPQMAATIGTRCAPTTKRFAATLAAWQKDNRLPATGAVDPATLTRMKQRWQSARPFIAAFAGGACPQAAAEARLADATPKEGWLGKRTKLDPRALAALRRMVNAARAADPRIAADAHMLTIVSAFRSPAYDAAKCARGANCNGIAKARCSAHRTGTAVDLYVGALPGHSPVGSEDANRLHQTKTPAYRWLVRNARRFGFVNYVYEPWHWEWIGPAPHEPNPPIVIAGLDRQPARASIAKIRFSSPRKEPLSLAKALVTLCGSWCLGESGTLHAR